MAVWVLEFSICGRLLATAGQDSIVVCWTCFIIVFILYPYLLLQRVWVLRTAYHFFHELQMKYAKFGKSGPKSPYIIIHITLSYVHYPHLLYYHKTLFLYLHYSPITLITLWYLPIIQESTRVLTVSVNDLVSIVVWAQIQYDYSFW